MRRRAPALSEQLRHAIESCGKSRYQLSQETGIDQATLSRFMNGKGGLSIPVLDQLGEVLGLKIIVAKRRDTNRSREYGEHQ
jgi:transcriptional regulator with XRE-family HTH domain